jgi:hypothetical protein
MSPPQPSKVSWLDITIAVPSLVTTNRKLGSHTEYRSVPIGPMYIKIKISRGGRVLSIHA